MRTRTTSTVHRPSSIVHLSDDRGVALILTLAILVLVTMLVIAFAVSMRVENTASKNFNDLIKARQLAQGAIDQAVATIRNATPLRTASPFSTYVTFPGVIYDNSGAATTPVDLYSVHASDQTNLNAGLWITGGTDGNGEFTTANSPINVGWIYVAQNPSAGLGPNNPIIGRYAFWVDDEAAKLNVNTAGLGAVPADVPYASAQKELDLGLLLPSPFPFASAVQSGGATYSRATYPYTTVEEIRRANPGITADIFDDNRFSVTAYSDDAYYPSYDLNSDLDAFGIPRRVTDALTEAIDIQNSPATNVSLYARLSDNTTLGKIYSGTFAGKYPVVNIGVQNVDGLKQLIANIMGYQADLATTWPPDGGGAPPAYLGLAKSPYINEVQIRYDVTPAIPPATSATVTRTVSVELFYMYDGRYLPTSEQLLISGLPPVGGLFSDPPAIGVAGLFVGGGVGPPTYRVFTQVGTATFSGSPKVESTTPQISYTRNGHRLNFAQMTLPRNQLSDTASASFYQGSQIIGDPAFNEVPSTTEWQQYTDGASATLQSPNKNTLTGQFYPFGVTNKFIMRGGPMLSIGELGYIHLPPDSALTNAWKHLTLQPGGGSTGTQIPDWAILDLFTVDPAVVPKPTAGRININSFINPAFPSAATRRLVPLEALLNGVVAPASVSQVAQHIYDGNFVPPYSATAYNTIGEICEVSGLADDASKDEKVREEAIRRIANLITVRSSTFTIWVMAQSIKQPPTNPNPGTYNPTYDLITGEVRAQAVVERYENPPGTTPKFRTRYFRYL